MTEVATGANAQVLMAKEAEYGVTPPSDKFKKYVFKSCGLDGSQSLIENDDLGMGREALSPTLGRKSVSGDIKVPVCLNSIGMWLTGLLGSAVTTDNAGVYTHVFSSGKESLPSFTIEKSFKEVKDYSLFNGCKFGSMDFDFQSDGNASVAVFIIGKKESNSETSIQASPAQLDYKPFSNAQGFVKVDGIDADTQVYHDIPTDPLKNGLVEISEYRGKKNNFHYVVYDATIGNFLDPSQTPSTKFKTLRFLEVNTNKQSF